jgi:hypothetical protein
MTDLTIEQRVANGAAWLDERIPNWADRISLLDFDMREDCNCVIGQVVGNYSYIIDGLDVPPDHVVTETEAAELGFDAHARVDRDDRLDSGDLECQPEFEALQAEWTKVISARREVTSDAR